MIPPELRATAFRHRKSLAIALIVAAVAAAAATWIQHERDARHAALERDLVEQLLSDIERWEQNPTLESADAIERRLFGPHHARAVPRDLERFEAFRERLRAMRWDSSLDAAVGGGDYDALELFLEHTEPPETRQELSWRLLSELRPLGDETGIRRQLESLSKDELLRVKESGEIPGASTIDDRLRPFAVKRLGAIASSLLDERARAEEERRQAAGARRDQAAKRRAARADPLLKPTLEDIALRPSHYIGSTVRIDCADLLGRRPRPIQGTSHLGVTVESRRGTLYFGTAGDVRVLATAEVARELVELRFESERFSCCTLYAECTEAESQGAPVVVVIIYAVKAIEGGGITLGGFD